MKIAIVSDDHQTISAHFGRAQFYEIFTIEAGNQTDHQSIARSFPVLTPVVGAEPDGQHPHQHDHNAMLIPIADCQALITRGMGNGAHISLKEHGIQPIITDIQDIQAALQAYLSGSLLDHPEKLH